MPCSVSFPIPWRACFGISVLFLLLARPAQATGPRLNTISPLGAQRGTQHELRFSGDRLADTKEILFYAPGLEVVELVSVETNRVRASIKIASDCRLGEHHLRLRTHGGISEVRTFYVGAFPNSEEVEPNNSPDKAQEIFGNRTIAGTLTSEDFDCFRVAAKTGERISVEVEAMRLGREALDAVVTIQDRAGKVLGSSDDTALLVQDGLLTVLAPADGDYIIQLRDAAYAGSSSHLYRLHVGNFPRPTAIYPAGGKAGEILSARFIGDARGEFIQEIQLPPEPHARFAVFAEQDGNSVPSPNWIRVSPFGNILEVEPNNTREQATAVASSALSAFNGVISTHGDHDWFRFSGQSGQALDVQVFARRLRSGLDSYLDIYDAKGKNLASNDDSAGPDSYLKFTPPADGEYLLRVKDQLDQGAPDFVYRVEVTPVQTGLSLSIPQVARYDSQTRQYVNVPQGNRYAILISAKRVGFGGELNFDLPGLPAGLKMHAGPMLARVDAMPIVFEAEPEAEVEGGLLELVARTTNGIEGKFNHKLELVRGPNNTFYYETSVDKLYVGVAEPAPFKIKILEPNVPLVQYGTLELRIEAERAAGFDEPINIKMLWNPPGVGSLPEVTIAKDENYVSYQLNAKSDAPTQTWKIAVLGSAIVDGGTVHVSSQLASLKIGDPFLLGKIETNSAEPGQSAKLICKLEQKVPFEGKAQVRLLGLNDKIRTTEQQITSQDTEVVFPLEIDPKCPTGSQRSLFCQVVIPLKNEHVSLSIGNGGVFRVVPPKKNAAKVVAKGN